MITSLDRTHAIRSPSEQKITLSELLVLGNVRDHSGHIKDHSSSVFLLTSLTIDLQLNVHVSTVGDGAFVDVLGYRSELV